MSRSARDSLVLRHVADTIVAERSRRRMTQDQLAHSDED